MTALATDSAELMEFLEAVRNGAGDLTAALSVNWSPRQLRTLMEDPDFRDLVAESKLLRTESIEEVVVTQARKGSRWAAELYLFCHAADRGWRPPAQRHQHVHAGVANPDLVASVTEMIRGRLAAGDPMALIQGQIVEVDADDVRG